MLKLELRSIIFVLSFCLDTKGLKSQGCIEILKILLVQREGRLTKAFGFGSHCLAAREAGI